MHLSRTVLILLMTNMEKRYFKTTNFYLACFLFAKGIELVNIDRITDKKRYTFVFIESEEIETFTHAFNFSLENDEEVMVDARKIIHSIKTLKDKLYQNN